MDVILDLQQRNMGNLNRFGQRTQHQIPNLQYTNYFIAHLETLYKHKIIYQKLGNVHLA